MEAKTEQFSKKRGKVYTPDYIVKNILDLSSYSGNAILKKHIIDNSCGDGSFLCQIVNRYCKEAIYEGMTTEELQYDLKTFIHGIEIEEEERNKCIENIDLVAAQYGVKNTDWDIICEDALNVSKYNGKMDFVLGNPPYVRVHNLGNSFDSVKQFSYAKGGMTDLYIAFYEIGINMLAPNGTLGYITPNSFYNSIAGKLIRKKIVNENLLDKVVNLKHYQAFNTTTYTTVVILKKERSDKKIEYFEYDEKNQIPNYVDLLTYEDCFIAGNYYFARKNDLSMLHRVFENTRECSLTVKNGYATLCDDVFIHNFEFESKLIIPVIKSSKGTKQKIFFPYDKKGGLLPEEIIRSDVRVYKYLLENRDKLLKRSNEKDSDTYWYAFGRSQAIKDTFKDKLAISSLLRTEKDLKFTEAPCGTGVYGGLYIVSQSISFENIKNVLKTEEFAKYVMLLGKYKSGGYYTFSSRDVKKYLDYKLTMAEDYPIMNNNQFLEVIRRSFETYLCIGNSRSPAKLKTLHGSIANDLQEIFGADYSIKSQGYDDEKKGTINGRYYPKKVDITVSRSGKPVAGYAIKFVMRNYSQNSNNYFENMLGETANIRCNSVPYFQIFIVFEKVPYYNSDGILKKYDTITEHNLEKYFVLSKDNPDAFFHTPDKTLIVVVNLKKESDDCHFSDSKDYADYYKSVINDSDLMGYSTKIKDVFGNGIILNDYSDFIKRTYYIAKGKIKN